EPRNDRDRYRGVRERRGGLCAPLFTSWPETRSHVLRQELWLFPRREMSAFVVLVVVNELGIRPLRPAPRGWIEFVREDAHGNRDGDALDIEKPEFAPKLPIETGARERRVGQPGDRDVVEDVIAREAGGFSCKDACDQIVAARVVIEEIRR